MVKAAPPIRLVPFCPMVATPSPTTAAARRRQRPEALLFDVDGTLAETERDGHRVAFNRAFRDAGLDWEWSQDLYGELLRVTGGKERIRHFVQHYRPDYERPADWDGFVAALHESKNRQFAALLAGGAIGLRPGVRRLLGEARSAGVRLLIVTTTSPENVDALLEHCLEPGARGWFELIAAGDVVPAKKPAPDIYRYALAHCGLEPGACVAFEDSANGLRAALGAGVPTVVTVSRYSQGEDFAGARLVVDHLGEPGRPCTVLAGDAVGDVAQVDLPLLAELLAGGD